MTQLITSPEAPSDAELISRVRGGDTEAYGELFSRHVEAARRLARQLVRGPDADDLVSDAFAKVMSVLRAGGGPDIAFRAYLLTAVRRLHVDRVRAQSRLTSVDDMTPFDPGVPFRDTAVESFESGAAARAFASLPERWQLVLWHLEVEGQRPAEIAPLLGMSANSVSALAYRAREGLRQAFLAAHLADTADAGCRWVTENLGGYVRKGLAKRDTAKIDLHLQGCRSCTATHLELTELNSDLAGILAPLLLGSLAAGYAATAGGASAGGGALFMLDRAKDFVAANLAPVAAGTTAAGVAAATAVTIVVTGVAPPRTTSAHGALPAQAPAPAAGTPSEPRPAPAKVPRVRRDTVTPVAATQTGPVAVDTVPVDAVPVDTVPVEPVVVVDTPSDGTVDPVDTGDPGTPEAPPASDPGSTVPAPDPGQDPADPGATTPAHAANLAVASAGVTDDAVVVGLDGLPEEAVTVRIELSSTSGRTRFRVGEGPCTVTAARPDVASCVAGSAAARLGATGPARPTYQAVVPLDYPGDLDSDELAVTVSVDGYDDPDLTDNVGSFTFRPNRPAQPTQPAEPTQPADPEPTQPADPEPTQPADPEPTPPAEPTDPEPSQPADPEPTQPADPEPTPPAEPTDPQPAAHDLGLDLDRGIFDRPGRFRAEVWGLPDSGTTPVRFDLSFSDPGVVLAAPPAGCSFVDGGHRAVQCETSGKYVETVFEADLQGVPSGTQVSVTAQVSIPGETDPQPANNRRTLVLRWG